MERELTIAATAGGLALAALAHWGGRRAHRAPRVTWTPWGALLFLGLMAALFGAIHLLTLAGR